MITGKTTMKNLNGDLYKRLSEDYRNLFKKIIKSIPKSVLIQALIEMKIIKKDYVTKEIKLLEVKDDTN